MNPFNRRDFLVGATATLGVAALAQRGAAVGPAGASSVAVLEVNGTRRSLPVLEMTSLAQALRADGLTGTKLSCEGGACGACTVLVDGRPRVSCMTLAADVEDQAIRTIEGVANGDTLHPIQRAVIEADGLQCGFCTPGFVMSGVAFFESYKAAGRTDEPTSTEVAHALAGNLCRCGAHNGLIEAVRAACVGRRAIPSGGRAPGEDHAIARVDAVDKVTGRARYTVDIQLEGMVHGVFLRAPVPAGRITKLDVAAALATPGVLAVETSPIERKEGLGRIRYAGQPIAVVAAETLEAARAGAARIVLAIEEAPFVIDPIDAEKDRAPLVYAADERNEAPGAGEAPKEPEAIRQWSGNLRGSLATHTNDEDPRLVALVDTSPLKADLRVQTQVQVHATLERHATVAAWKDGKLTVWASTQTVQLLAEDLAKRLGVSASDVRVLSSYVGGGFGSKATMKPEHVAAALLSRKLGRPVRIELSFAEHLLVGGHRPGTLHRVRVGAQKNGALRAVVHAGRSFCGVAVGERATGLTSVHYAWAPTAVVDKNVVTNTPPACAFRAPGFPGNAFALEQAIDSIALQAGAHPLALRAGFDPSPVRKRVAQLLMDKAGRAARVLDVARDKGRFARGIGIATAEWFVLTAPSTRVELTVFRDGRARVRTATQDIGQGARTVLASVVHDRLGIAPERIEVEVGDSSLPLSTGTFGSMTTTSISSACQRACEQVETALTQTAGKSDRVERIAGGLLRNGKRVTFAALLPSLPAASLSVIGIRGDDNDGFHVPPGKLGPIAEVTPVALGRDIVASAQLAEVEVDRLLGRVVVRRVVVALDAGRLIAPITAKSQVVGAVLQGVSRALYEERRLDTRSGKLLSRSFDSYGILGVADAPDVEVHFVDEPSKNTPTGALGLGENSTIATCAAVANAVMRATGKRVLTSPLTPRRVLEVLA